MERIDIGAYLLWVVVLAVHLLRTSAWAPSTGSPKTELQRQLSS